MGGFGFGCVFGGGCYYVGGLGCIDFDFSWCFDWYDYFVYLNIVVGIYGGCWCVYVLGCCCYYGCDVDCCIVDGDCWNFVGMGFFVVVCCVCVGCWVCFGWSFCFYGGFYGCFGGCFDFCYVDFGYGDVFVYGDDWCDVGVCCDVVGWCFCVVCVDIFVVYVFVGDGW